MPLRPWACVFVSVAVCLTWGWVGQAPDAAARLAMLAAMMARIPLSPDVSLSLIAAQAAGLLPADLGACVRAAAASAAVHAWRTHPHAHAIATAEPCVRASDLTGALAHIQAAYADAVGAAKVCVCVCVCMHERLAAWLVVSE
jgi:hypothetical protein